MTLLGQSGRRLGGAAVLPDDGVVDGLAGLAVPHNSGFTLVGDTYSCDVFVGCISAGESESHDLTHVVPDLVCVVLDPACLREDLVVFELAH